MPPLASSSEESYSPDLFIMGEVSTNNGVLVTGQNLPEYAALGRIAATGKFTQCVESASDGSEKAVAILIYPIDATAADKDCQLYIGGQFNAAKVVWHASFDNDAKKQGAFDGTAISLKTVGV